jgi:hypothetical protein
MSTPSTTDRTNTRSRVQAILEALEEPQNFSEYRQIEIDAAYANLFSQMKDVPYMSKRWAMKRYLGLNETEIAENEKLWRQEQAVPHATEDSGAVADLRSVGVGGEEGEEDFGDEDMGDGGDIPGGEDAGAEIDLEA